MPIGALLAIAAMWAMEGIGALIRPEPEKAEALRIDDDGCLWVYSIEGDRVANVDRARDRAGKHICGGSYGQ